MVVRPLYNQVLLTPLKETTMPDTLVMVLSDHEALQVGTVRDLGDEVYDLIVGHRVVFPKQAGTRGSDDIGEYVLLPESAILAIWHGDPVMYQSAYEMEEEQERSKSVSRNMARRAHDGHPWEDPGDWPPVVNMKDEFDFGLEDDDDYPELQQQ